MDSNDIIINDKNFSKFSRRIESYLSEMSDYLLNQTYSLKSKTDEALVTLNNLQEDLDAIFVSEDDNYNLFSPTDKVLLNKKEKLKTEISLYELQLNECKEEFSNLNNNIEHINEVKNYVMFLEDAVKKNSQTSPDKNGFSSKADNEQEKCSGLQILQNQELERKRIARELHDSTVQNLTSLIHKTELCSKYVDIDHIRTKLELEIMKKTLRTTINDMREIIFDLRPMSLDDLGLIPTVERFIKQITDSSNIKITFNYEDDNSNIYSIIHLTLFRFIQEACNNVLKHAKADNIEINLTYDKSDINLEIKDDGIGFDIEKHMKESLNNSNFGLSIMKERVYLLSGQINIESKKNMGTKISINIPMSFCMEEKE